MARRCPISNKGVMAGNNVSHANNKTRRRFKPNLQRTSLMSEALGRSVRVRLSANGLRTVEHNGGIDALLLETPAVRLTPQLRRLKRELKRAKKAQEGQDTGA
jgi:large subunit ribosomal protein L28